MIDLRPEIEAALTKRAESKGVSVNEYVGELLTASVPDVAPQGLTPAERVALWMSGLENLPRTPPLSDEDISRESIYCRA